jgi:long-subunit fatty acid transport protein
MASIHISKISGSASAFSQNSVRSKGAGFDDTAKNFSTTPTQITTVLAKEKFNLGFSILIPASFTSNVKRTTNKDSIGTYVENIDVVSQNTLLGPTIAFSISPEFKTGMSLFIIKNEHKEVSDTSFGLDSGPSRYLDIYRDNNTATALFPVLEFLYTPNKNLSFGLRFSAPSIQISGEHESTIKQYENDGTNPEVTSTDKQQKKRTYKNPLDIGFGISYQYDEHFRILADVSNQFKQNYTAYLHDAYNEDEIINLKNTTRYNLGFEYQTSRTDAITCGLNYNPDPRKVEESLNFYGVTVGYKSLEKMSDTRFGFFYNQAKATANQSSVDYQIIGLILSTSINFHNL